ncbi:hypothetical protein CJ030_MR3G009935 [Morella rubra]|uniref:Uncharacterized protein n=1 Tax=Morella rubra TaxID=262757 RepID=A0A6A1W5R8_9ROSI|nr:hypothetical protein CJ030_MR3G009935 [Morella rubra]
MGSCLAIGREPKSKSFAEAAAMCNHLEVLRVVKTDGKILEYTRPMLVKDILMGCSGYGIGLSERPLRHLPLNYELKLGHVYYLLPVLPSPPAYSSCSVEMDGSTGRTKRVKLVVTKQQLQEFLSEKISVEKILLLGNQNMESYCGVGCVSSSRPLLETIPEGSHE